MAKQKDKDSNIAEERKYMSYTVQPGETLYSIAAKFGKNYQVLSKLNGTNLSVGSQIIIPV